jgi:hypothetical protein
MRTLDEVSIQLARLLANHQKSSTLGMTFLIILPILESLISKDRSRLQHFTVVAIRAYRKRQSLAREILATRFAEESIR